MTCVGLTFQSTFRWLIHKLRYPIAFSCSEFRLQAATEYEAFRLKAALQTEHAN
jgi:hypothetical protein